VLSLVPSNGLVVAAITQIGNQAYLLQVLLKYLLINQVDLFRLLLVKVVKAIQVMDDAY
jgi:hypothetical protein